jgi:hypothetical protein
MRFIHKPTGATGTTTSSVRAGIGVIWDDEFNTRGEFTAAEFADECRELVTRWADELEELPTISQCQDADLKVDTGHIRVWLSRCGLKDGEPFARTVYVEEHKGVGWWSVGYYDGDEPDPNPAGTLADGWNATRDALEKHRGTYRTYADRLHKLGLGTGIG